MSRWTKFVDWFRRHLMATLAAGALAGGSATWAAVTTLEQTRINRFEERMLADFQIVAESDQALAINLEKFSFDLSTGNSLDAALVRQMNSELVRMYVTLESFKLGLDSQSAEKISAYQSALTDFKTELLKTKVEGDLQFLASRYIDVLRASSAAKPVIEERIGTSMLKNS